jgi:hypothetical protein
MSHSAVGGSAAGAPAGNSRHTIPHDMESHTTQHALRLLAIQRSRGCAVQCTPRPLSRRARAHTQTGAQERTRRRLRRALRRLVALLQRGSCGDGQCDQLLSAYLLRRTAGGSARGLPMAEWAEVALEVEGRRLSLSEQLANPAPPPSAEFRMLRDACVQAACCASQAAAATAGSARFMRRALDGADVPSSGPVERRSNVSVNERPLRRHSDLIRVRSTATWA